MRDENKRRNARKDSLKQEKGQGDGGQGRGGEPTKTKYV